MKNITTTKCHSGESRNLKLPRKHWIPAFAGMTVFLYLSLAWAADPKTEHQTHAITTGISAIKTVGEGAANFTECSDDNYEACVKGVKNVVAGVAEGVTALEGFDNADKLDTSGSANTISTSSLSSSTTDNLCNSNPSLCEGSNIDVKAFKGEVQKTVDQAKNFLTQPGLNIDKMMKNETNEKQGISQEKAQEKPQEKSQEKDESRSLAYTPFSSDYQPYEGRDPSAEFDFSQFMGMFDSFVQEGLQASSPGYYGNVPLKDLDPTNKMSLFERVSKKVGKLM